MEATNLIISIIGIFVLLIGVVAFFNPGFTRVINFPGGPKLKAIVAVITGVIILIIGLFYKLPIN